MTRTQLLVEKNKRRQQIRRYLSGWIITFSIAAVGFLPIIAINVINAHEISPQDMLDGQLYQVEATAYCNDTITASGRPTVEHLTLAGAREWLGYTCLMYDEDMHFLGYFQFTDTGYGRDGDILRGETIDIFMGSGDEAEALMDEWGRRKVYIQIVKADG